MPTTTKASTLPALSLVGAALCDEVVELVVLPPTAAATTVPVWIVVIVSVVVDPRLSVTVVVTVTVVVVRPVREPVSVYHPLGPTPPYPIPPQPMGPPKGPHPEQEVTLAVQLEYSEQRDEYMLEAVAKLELGHAEETQLASAAVLVHSAAQALVHEAVENAEEKQD